MLSDKEVEVLSSIPSAIKDSRPFIVKGVFDELLSSKQFESLLNNSAFADDKRFFPTDNTTHYKWDLPLWATTNSWTPEIIEELLDKTVCYMTDCSRVTNKINSVASMLEELTGRPVDTHIYFSKSKTQKNNFGIHLDYAHNLIVQTQGKTRWRCGDKQHLDGERNIDSYDGFVIDEVLEEGDAIFVPAYIYHSPTNLNKRVSCSFPIPSHEGNFQSRHWINW